MRGIIHTIIKQRLHDGATLHSPYISLSIVDPNSSEHRAYVREEPYIYRVSVSCRLYQLLNNVLSPDRPAVATVLRMLPVEFDVLFSNALIR